jgi:hypothetical protein
MKLEELTTTQIKFTEQCTVKLNKNCDLFKEAGLYMARKEQWIKFDGGRYKPTFPCTVRVRYIYVRDEGEGLGFYRLACLLSIPKMS